jgi:transcription elongation GreA/GreB family factor
MEKIPMTEEGQKKLLDELKHLKTVERPIIIKAIADARSNGDYLRMLSTMRLEKNKALLKVELLR